MKWCLAILAILMVGCTSQTAAVKIRASSATYANVLDVTWDEYKIPVISFYSGPKHNVYITPEAYSNLTELVVSGTVTNETSALGIYTSREQKTAQIILKK